MADEEPLTDVCIPIVLTATSSGDESYYDLPSLISFYPEEVVDFTWMVETLAVTFAFNGAFHGAQADWDNPVSAGKLQFLVDGVVLAEAPFPPTVTSSMTPISVTVRGIPNPTGPGIGELPFAVHLRRDVDVGEGPFAHVTVSDLVVTITCDAPLPCAPIVLTHPELTEVVPPQVLTWDPEDLALGLAGNTAFITNRIVNFEGMTPTLKAVVAFSGKFYGPIVGRVQVLIGDDIVADVLVERDEEPIEG